MANKEKERKLKALSLEIEKIQIETSEEMELFKSKIHSSNTNTLNVINKKIKENEKISKVTFDLKGKIIYLTIELKEGTTEDAQAIAIKSLEYLSTEEKEFYDINFIFTNTAEDDNAKFFPLMGYKKSDATLISWIKQSERK